MAAAILENILVTPRDNDLVIVLFHSERLAKIELGSVLISTIQ